MIIPGRGITDFNDFIRSALSSMRDFLEADGNEFIYRRFIEPNESPMMFAKSLNRSVTGSMNGLINDALFYFRYKDWSLWDISQRINKAPMSHIQYLSPCEAFKHMAIDQDFEM